MKRNMDLVRTILTRIESWPRAWAPREQGIGFFTLEEIGYHARIMLQEGLVEELMGLIRWAWAPRRSRCD